MHWLALRPRPENVRQKADDGELSRTSAEGETLTEFRADESSRERWLRRAVTVPAYLVAGVTALTLCPLLLVLAAVADATRGRRPFVFSRVVLGL